MLTFKRNGDKVELKLTTYIPNAGDWTYTFNWNSNSETYACLLIDRFNKTMREKLQGIRQEAYEHGWKDAKAKVKKEDWFKGGWD